MSAKLLSSCSTAIAEDGGKTQRTLLLDQEPKKKISKLRRKEPLITVGKKRTQLGKKEDEKQR